jgi:Asp-tRNA(Asn)/Glu-tRNA(Gln) amidotransferase A subunit family amidase
MRAEEYRGLDATSLARLIKRGDVSPIEATEAALAQLKLLEPFLNAFDSVDADGALRAAQQALRHLRAGRTVGPLHGVPISIKDLIDVRGLPARYGSLTLKDNVALADAPSVHRIRTAGAIIIGKTTTSEFGARGYTWNRLNGGTKNPWALARSPGGSSGGAAASVAAGVTPFALGTDGGGSIRAPAALTGLFGIKATFGRVPVWPASATPMLSHVGPLARTLNDARLLLEVISGPDPRDQFSFLPPLDWQSDHGGLRALRVAFAPTMGYGRVDAPVASVVETAVAALRVVFPNIELITAVCDEAAEIFATEFMAGCVARLGTFKHSSDDLDPAFRASVERFQANSSQQVAESLRQRYRIKDQVAALFDKYDLLITPTVPCVSWDIERCVPPGHEQAIAWSYFTYPFNLTGQPAGTLPCGLAYGLPVGLQMVAPLCREDRLLKSMAAAAAVVSNDFGVSVELRASTAC